MFKSKKSSSVTSSNSPTTPTTPERIRSKQPFSAVPLDQRKLAKGHIPINELLQVYDDYPLLVKDYENLREQYRLAERDIETISHEREELQVQLDKEKEGREDDRIKAREAKEEAERSMNRKVRDELDPKIADLEKKLREMTQERDDYKEELKVRTSKMDGWVGQLARLHGESAQQAEKEAKAAEERQKVLEKSRKLNLEILEGLREISVDPGIVKKDTTAEKPKDATTSSIFREDVPKKTRRFDAADGA